MDFDEDGFIRRISPRLRNALVADKVAGCDDAEEGDRHLLRTSSDCSEWTAHLARQLGMGEHLYLPDDVHATLMVVIGELDRVLRDPALLRSTTEPREIAEAATRHLGAEEAEAMLLLGPESWRRDAEDQPSSTLRARANRALSSALARLFQQWDEWDVVRLVERWHEAQALRTEKIRKEKIKAEEERRRRRVAAMKPKRVRGKLIPPPPSVVECAAAKAGRIKERRPSLPYYEPPWESSR
jgi:hypothetical protein